MRLKTGRRYVAINRSLLRGYKQVAAKWLKTGRRYAAREYF